MPDTHRLNLSAGIASVAVAFVLVGLKLWGLWQTGALSVAASLADSALDLVISVGGLVAIWYASRPADDDHAFGHTSVEDLFALAQAVFVALSGFWIAERAIQRLLQEHPTPLAQETVGMGVMAASVFLTLALVGWQRMVAARTGNKVVASDSLHYISDLMPTLGALFALWAAKTWGLAQIDSIVALLASAFMLRGALKIGHAAWDSLMDRAADPATLDGIAAIARGWPGVKGFHDLKTRTAGSRLFVHLHIELDGDQSLREAHEIGAGLRRAILAAYPQADVIIHKDVAGET